MRVLLAPLNSLLAFLGRNGTLCFALSIFLGLALPQLASAMRPMLAISAFIFIMLNFARTDAANLRATLARPIRFAAASVWVLGAPPLVLLASFLILPRASWNQDILLAVALYAGAPSLMGCPAYAMLLGFRNGMIIALLFVTLALCPFVAPPLIGFLTGHGIPIDQMDLALRLLVLVGGAILAGLVLRRAAGARKLDSWKHQIDGVGVVCYFLFAIAAMDGVIGAAFGRPLHVLALLGLVFGLALFGQLAALACMGWLGPNDAFTLSLGTGLRNVGLLIAALGTATPKETYLVFALGQFPIYLAPLLASPLARLYRRRIERAEAANRPTMLERQT